MVVLFVVVVALLFLVLNWYVAPTQPSERKDLVLALAQILGGTALLSGLYFTWRTLQVNRQGQITERFTRAIDQLGATDEEGKKLFEIRLGGIYALERIARESEEDHWPIMEVLTAYVRQHTKGQEGMEEAAVENSEGDLNREPKLAELPTPDPDIRAIMTVLRRRTRSFYYGGEPEPLDLRETNLSGVDLLQANLRGANLEGAILWKADLQSANLREANLKEAILWEANLRSANLWIANLEGATLRKANLWSANLSEANLKEANLWGATLRNVDLYHTHLQGANLRETDFYGAELWDARLRGADLSGADLSEAQGPSQADLEETVGDANTKLPPDLKPPAHWSVKTQEQTEED